MWNRRQAITCTNDFFFLTASLDPVMGLIFNILLTPTHVVSTESCRRSFSIRMVEYRTLSASRVKRITPSSLLGLTRYAPRMAHRAVADISASLQPHLLPRPFVSATALPISLGLLSGLFPT
jgi:hypothetical protein